MSFRLYPQYIKGNPQLRIFLPNFWMKLIKSKSPTPTNMATFLVPLEMSDMDIRNYLEKIYKIPVVEIRSRVFSGELKKTHKNYLIKEDDYRLAFVTMSPQISFKFPDLYPQDKIKEKEEDHKKLMTPTEDLTKQKRKSWDRADVPSWFGI